MRRELVGSQGKNIQALSANFGTIGFTGSSVVFYRNRSTSLAEISSLIAERHAKEWVKGEIDNLEENILHAIKHEEKRR